MPESGKPNGSPTAKLLVGLVLTLAAVLLFAYYMTGQLSGLRALQSNLVDRNRKDSLQLLRVQNDLNSLALAMRDMLDASEPYLPPHYRRATTRPRIPGRCAGAR